MHLLCVCTGNTCRSPMLMTLLRAELQRSGITQVQVSSAGTSASIDEPASDHAQTCMLKRGLSLAQHRSQSVGEVDIAHVDRFLCMTSSHAAAIRALGVPASQIEVVNAARHGVPDPYGGELADYEACAAVLQAYAQEFVRHLRQTAGQT